MYYDDEGEDPYDAEGIWERTKNFIDTSKLTGADQQTLKEQIKLAYDNPHDGKAKDGYEASGSRVKNLKNTAPDLLINSEKVLEKIRAENPILRKNSKGDLIFTKGTRIDGVSVGGRFVPKSFENKKVLERNKDFYLPGHRTRHDLKLKFIYGKSVL